MRKYRVDLIGPSGYRQTQEVMAESAVKALVQVMQAATPWVVDAEVWRIDHPSGKDVQVL